MKIATVQTFWLKNFIDWLRGLSNNNNCSNENRNFYFDFKYLISIFHCWRL